MLLKGTTMSVVGISDWNDNDKVSQYQSFRCVSTNEAIWRFFWLVYFTAENTVQRAERPPPTTLSLRDIWLRSICKNIALFWINKIFDKECIQQKISTSETRICGSLFNQCIGAYLHSSLKQWRMFLFTFVIS